MDEPEFIEKIRQEYVAPLYLHGMRHEGSADIVARLARSASADEVAWMLTAPWRERRVGAWFTLARDDDWSDDLLASLATSRGDYTARDLGFAALRRVGPSAVPALLEYQKRAAEQEYSGQSAITALIETVGQQSPGVEATEADRDWVRAMNRWADSIEKAGRSE
jgi:hypothetical protein